MTHETVSIELSGTLIGRIWMPAVECYKPATLRFKRSPHGQFCDWHKRFDNLREALCHITNDGDFQYCVLADFPTLKVVRRSKTTGATRTRYWQLRGTGNEDCVQPERMPEYNDEN